MNIKKGIMHVLIANIINLVFSLFAGFVLPKFLSIETYSSIKLFQLYITYTGILHFGFSDGMYLRHGGKNINNIDKNEVGNEFKTFKLFQLVMTIICIIISLVLRNQMLLFCSLVILPINVGNYIRNLYSAIGEFKKYSRFTNINTLLIFIINVTLLFIIKTDKANIFILSYIVVYFIYWLIIELEHRKLFGKGNFVFVKDFITNNIKSGFSLMIGSFCNVLFTSIDRLFVEYLFDTIKFAFYSFAVSIENLMNVFINPISTTLYNYFCNHNTKEEILKIKRLILVFSAFIVLSIFPARFVVETWLSKYSSSINVLILLFAAQYISIMVRCVHVNLYKSFKKQKRYFRTMIFIVGLSIILDLCFYYINKSIEFIALATLITNVIWFIIGEIEFREYHLKYYEYIYLFTVLGLFLFCGKFISYIGLSIYLVSIIVLTSLLLREPFKYYLNDIKKIFKKFRIKSDIVE